MGPICLEQRNLPFPMLESHEVAILFTVRVIFCATFSMVYGCVSSVRHIGLVNVSPQKFIHALLSQESGNLLKMRQLQDCSFP